MSFPKYRAVKDSGVEWIGEVPRHWAVQPLKRHARLLTEKTDRRDHPVALENIESWTGRFVPTETEFEGEGVAFEAADVLFGKLRPYLAKTLVAHSSGEAVGDFLVMRPSDAAKARFIGYQLRSREVISIIDGSTFGSKMPRASWDFVGAMPFTLPPAHEQEAIVSFLDRETSKIDTLVEEQRRLIELLKEKRQAVISQAVTKGLDTSVPMRHSGVAWLGMVPVHWDMGALRWYAKCTSGSGIATDAVEEIRSEGHAVPVIGGNGLMGFTDRSSLDQMVLAVGRVGALCGNVHIVPPPSWVTDNALVVRPDHRHFRLPYIAAVLRARGLNDIAAKTAQPLITGTQVMDQRVPIPPMSEQEEIVNFIDAHAKACDALIVEAEGGSRLLQERRSALISAAVTGKIDVRGLVTQPEPLAA